MIRSATVLFTAAALCAAPAAWAVDAVTPTDLGALGYGQSVSTTKSLSKSSYGDNPALMNSAWAHAGGAPWYSFQITQTTDVLIDLTPLVSGANFNPGLTLWASGSSLFNGGSENIETGPNNGWGAPHSFNAVGQIGDAGTLWASGAAGNLVQTLVYAVTGPGHTDGTQNGWGEVINTGIHDISTDNSFEQGISGSISGTNATLNNEIHLYLSQLAAGYYTVFIGGTNNALASANYQLDITALAAGVPEPGSWALMLTGAASLLFLQRRRRPGTPGSAQR